MMMLFLPHQVLDRLLMFSFMRASPAIRRRVYTAFVVIIIIVTIINTAGICSSIAVAYLTVQVGNLHSSLSHAYESRNTADINLYTSRVDSQNQLTSAATSIQQFCEVSSLLLIVVTFVIAGSFCFRRLRSSSTRSSPSSEFRRLSRQITATVAAVFVTFLLRAAFSMLNALAWALQVQSTMKTQASTLNHETANFKSQS